ncbi:hypothetical protein S1OALGB6SA_1514, partial [Olavius algarvensis spirochete endosymbiont]|uniref:hypothetical protein n=1 Tax=Olavius algarvensis spirochete endosymbiont TaxID=260710 RepID=UPI000F20E9A7
SFEEESKIWDKWFEENLDPGSLESLYLLSDKEYHREVEERLANYYRDADFFLIYFARNIDNGVLSTTLFFNSANTWNQIEWTEDTSTGRSFVVETKHEIADFDTSDKELARLVIRRRYFYARTNYLLVGATSVHIYIFDEGKIGRFAFYGGRGAVGSPVYIKRLLQEVRGCSITAPYR